MHLHKAQTVLNMTKNKPCTSVFFFNHNESIDSLILRLRSFSGISGEFETKVLKQHQVLNWGRLLASQTKSKCCCTSTLAEASNQFKYILNHLILTVD